MGKDAAETLFEPLEDLVGVILLVGLRICTTKDHIVMVLMGINSQVVIRLAGIPK